MKITELSDELAQMEVFSHESMTGSPMEMMDALRVLGLRLMKLNQGLQADAMKERDEQRDQAKPTENPDTCRHLDFEEDVRVTRFVGEADGTANVEISIRCKHCHRPFSWKGLPKGFGMGSGVSTWDGLKASLWIRPSNSEDASGLHQLASEMRSKDAS